VQVDVDGNGTADMEIILQGLAGQSLAAGNFNLGATTNEPKYGEDAPELLPDLLTQQGWITLADPATSDALLSVTAAQWAARLEDRAFRGIYAEDSNGLFPHYRSGADLLLQIDSDGNGAVDMEVILQGLAEQALTGSNFLL
jgi:hypothetical protein